MGIKTPYICEIAPDTYAINEFGLAAMYLLVGQREALLIDAGCGICDLAGVIAGLTDKPYRVALTHGHFDHAGGIGGFGQVYLHEADRPMVLALDHEALCGFADSFGKAGGYSVYDYSPLSIKPITSFPEFAGLRDGDRFDLGGRVVEIHEIPGHTPGGVSFLDINNRIIFSGDCCNVNLLAPNCSVTETLWGLRKFKALSGRFDQNFNGHVGYLGSATCLSQPRQVTDDLIYICESILNHEGTPVPYDFLGYPLTQMSFGSAKLSYDPNNIEGGTCQ